MQTEYLNRSNLASFYIETPDPQLQCPIKGERLVVQWHFPKCFLNYESLVLEITIRFGDHSEEVQNIALDKRYGYYIYRIEGTPYCEKKGIQTYKIKVLANGEVIETWHHQLWAELITVNQL